jgi:hypothetical protein
MVMNLTFVGEKAVFHINIKYSTVNKVMINVRVKSKLDLGA